LAKAGATAENCRLDGSMAIGLQKQMEARQTCPIRYDPSSANFMTPIKSVTIEPGRALNAFWLPEYREEGERRAGMTVRARQPSPSPGPGGARWIQMGD